MPQETQKNTNPVVKEEAVDPVATTDTTATQAAVAPKARGKSNRGAQGGRGGNRERRGRDGRDRREREDDGFEQKIVDLARVTRVMAGGKRMRFRACVAVGNKAGKVGVGVAKSIDVTTAISKAAEQAKKHAITVQIIDGTIAHDMSYKYGAARIMMKSAPIGRGIIAGGAMRIVLELAGIHNIVGKIQGSKNKLNIVRCVIEALRHLKQVEVKKEEKKPNPRPEGKKEKATDMKEPKK